MLPQNDEIRRVFSSAATDDPDFLFGDCYRGGYVVIRPASYIRDEKGTILTDAHGNPRFQMSDGFCFSVEEQIIV